MDRSRVTREARRSLLSAFWPFLLCVAALVWLMVVTRPMFSELGLEILSPWRWVTEVTRATPDEPWIGVLFGVVSWLLMSAAMVIAPAAALIAATPRIVRRVRRASALRRFDPDAEPDLILVREGEARVASVSGNPQRIAVLGELERLASDSRVARALSGETSVAVLGDRATLPDRLSRRLDGYLLNGNSRSSAVIVVDRLERRCWLMGRIVPQSALVSRRSRLGPDMPHPGGSGATALAVGGAVALAWADDAGSWEDSGGGWGDGGTDGGSGGGGDGGGGGGGDGGDGGGGGGGGGGE